MRTVVIPSGSVLVVRESVELAYNFREAVTRTGTLMAKNKTARHPEVRLHHIPEAFTEQEVNYYIEKASVEKPVNPIIAPYNELNGRVVVLEVTSGLYHVSSRAKESG